MTEKLTGNYRHRLGFRGRLVLQVEVERTFTLVCERTFSEHTVTRTDWRDATAKDLKL